LTNSKKGVEVNSFIHTLGLIAIGILMSIAILYLFDVLVTATSDDTKEIPQGGYKISRNLYCV